MIQELNTNYGHLFEAALLSEINQVGTFKEIPEGFKIMEICEYVKAMPLLVSGAIKILREDYDGDELLLYFLEKGDTFAMTLACCIGQTKSEIRAIAETDTKIIMVPIQKMDERLIKYLKEKSRSSKDDTLHKTHQEIAYELHTSRVVISRLLKKLENLNKIELHRNHIIIKDI